MCVHDHIHPSVFLCVCLSLMDYQHYFDCPCFGLANPCSGCAYMQEQLMKTWEFCPLMSATVHAFIARRIPFIIANRKSGKHAHPCPRLIVESLDGAKAVERKKKVNLFVTEDRCGEREPRNIRVLILVYVCPHNTICVLILLYRREGDLQ